MALHRPYIRKATREEVELRAEKNEIGQFLDVHTHEPIESKYDLGHIAGHEHWREVEQAEKEGLTQAEFNDRMNNPDFYQIEDPHENRSHAHEMPAENSDAPVSDKAPEKDKVSEDNNVSEADEIAPAKESAPVADEPNMIPAIEGNQAQAEPMNPEPMENQTLQDIPDEQNGIDMQPDEKLTKGKSASKEQEPNMEPNKNNSQKQGNSEGVDMRPPGQEGETTSPTHTQSQNNSESQNSAPSRNNEISR